MAIGDKPNQNLFGTNYNPEDEEEKKARLAAQGAMMGANVPAAAFGQAPAVAPFSMEAAGQVNPMMQPQSLAVTPQAPATFLPYADDVAPPPASALSVFTPGGEVKPNVDVNAITPSQEMTSPNPVNTALNQEVAVGPTSNDPGFLYNTFVNAPVKADQIATEFMSNIGNKISTGYDDLLGSAMRNLTPAEDRRFANNEPFGKTFTDTFAITRPDGTKFYPDEVTSSAGATQAPSEASALGATQGATPPVETPSEGAQGQGQSIQQGAPGSAQANFATRMATGEALTPQEIQDAQAFAASMGTTFDPATGYSREAFENAQTTQAQAATAPAGGLTTVGGASLSEFLSGQAMPEQGFTQAEPLSGRGVTLTPDQMNELSAQREARLDARLPGDQSVSDRDRRAARGDDISMADQTSMAKANADDATPTEVARGNQVANALGVDLKTGQSLQATGGLTFEQQLSLRKQNFAEGKFDYELAKDAKTAYSEGIEASQKATTEQAQADTAGRTMVSAISNMNDAMTRMGGRSGEFFGGGFFGKMASYLPGTSAYDQVADVEFLQSNVALNAMSELKELSPTGSTGFGALSEKELRVLTDKYANLNPFVSADLFQGNLKQLQGEFNNMLNNAWDKHSKEYSPEAANAVYGNRGGSASGATGTPGQAIPNDRNITSAADTLLSDPKYN